MSITPGPTGAVPSASPSIDAGTYSADPWGLESSFSRPVSSSLRADPWVRALFTTSQRAAAKKRSRRPGQSDAAPDADQKPGSSESVGAPYSMADAAPQLANPLSPLRDRDRLALGEIFAHDQMAAIEADILHRLSYLVPEPIWEVEPYEFLREFL
ncbi:hypothetical protein [Nodosilinea nodulosa]|uniref:hypothetical protein n=1 Tax=Nodosilinea nodulosa TaxID=416001 RepID=UPI001CED1388|nr:hypothetical protein [Nodosilinea nodulosa]